MIYIALMLIFIAMALLIWGITPIIVQQGGAIAQARANRMINKYDAVLSEDQIQKTRQMILVFPFLAAAAGFIFSPPDSRLAFAVAGAVLGIVLPKFYLSYKITQRKQKFNDQLVDALMIMSSSFRGGLSLIQAIEAVSDEMPDPLRQEFGIVLGENKMGVSLDESLNRLYKRMPSPGLQQMIVAILLARETGGNLALIFSRIINSIRERKKIEQSMNVLTIQGKIQAVVMSGLPLMFYFFISQTNPNFFDSLKNTPMGRSILILCVFLWIVGTAAIVKISQIKDS